VTGCEDSEVGHSSRVGSNATLINPIGWRVETQSKPTNRR
jgi:hypothetical protein